MNKVLINTLCHIFMIHNYVIYKKWIGILWIHIIEIFNRLCATSLGVEFNDLPFWYVSSEDHVYYYLIYT